jgi:spore germination cell wall hydrolase CwlJ-like protein
VYNKIDKAAWVFVLSTAAVLAALGFTMQVVFAYQDQRRNQMLEFHHRSLTCLARNVYYEARGEPLEGQYAVAEVTMNRRDSRFFPKTVCEVVYQQNWDPLRGRKVGAFSWTEYGRLPEPGSEEWQRSWEVAEAVYYHKYTPQLQGALFFHTIYVKPEWAKEKRRVARIGRHVFYR